LKPYNDREEAHTRGLTDRIREMIAKSPRMEEEVAKQAPEKHWTRKASE